MRTTLAGFLPDVATTFGGLWQPVRLRAVTVGFRQLHIEPDPDTGHVRIQGQISAVASQQRLSLQIDIRQLDAQQIERLVTSHHLH